MKTTLSTSVDEQDYERPPARSAHAPRARRVSLADRAALRLGLALITWSRRPPAVEARPSRDILRARWAAGFARTAREREWQRALYLSQYRR